MSSTQGIRGLDMRKQRIAEFHAVVFLPHGPNALRLSDIYAASIPAAVPEAQQRVALIISAFQPCKSDASANLSRLGFIVRCLVSD